MPPVYVVKLTLEEALRANLVFCECSHRPNNHHEFGDKPCAHCDCKEYRQRFSMGEEIKGSRSTRCAHCRRYRPCVGGYCKECRPTKVKK